MTPIRTLKAMLFIGVVAATEVMAASFGHTFETEFGAPLMPERIGQPYADVKEESILSGAAQLSKFFAQSGYNLKTVKQDNRVPELYVINLPYDLNQQPVESKINDFVRLLLPNVLAVNQQILKVRQSLMSMAKRPTESLTAKETVWLQGLANDYGLKERDVKSGKSKGVDIELLLQHIDVIPTGMVLAQGIDESGWGTSHFAIQGSALYGEHLPQSGGKYLTTPGGHVKVAAFDSLYQGTAAYIYNLNSSRAYHGLWQLRQQLRLQGKPVTGYELVGALVDYSVRGQAYVDNLRSLIEHHHLDSYDNAKFNSAEVSQLIRFKH